jgi:hypothetical protein
MSKQPRPKPNPAASQPENQRAAELLPSVEVIQAALSQAETLDDFFGKEGILAQLFARTIEQMLEGEVCTARLVRHPN